MSSDYSSRARLFHDALYDALAGSAVTVSDAEPLRLLASLVSRCRPSAGEAEAIAGALDAFDAVAGREDVDGAVSEASALFESPQRFREALYFLRCLDRDATGAMDLMRHLTYLSAAVTPAAGYPELATDQAALLDATTFETLWREPERLQSMEDAIERWREAYQPVYAAGHAAHTHHIAGIAGDVEATLWQVDALETLNRLERLGEPAAQHALGRYHAIGAISVCPATPEELAPGLSEAPVCPHCHYVLGDIAPVEDLNTSLIAIERGLATQRTRLLQRVVNRVLARPNRAQEPRLERFIQAVQTGDLSRLAQSLDEGLLAFLEDVLATPEPRLNLIDRLAQDFPEVTDESLDALVAAFRALVKDELQRGGGRVVIGREDGE